MGNEAGKGKYAKMNQGEGNSENSEESKRTVASNGNISQQSATEDSAGGALSKITGLKQGVNSGYHSIVLSPKSAEDSETNGHLSNENVDDT